MIRLEWLLSRAAEKCSIARSSLHSRQRCQMPRFVPLGLELDIDAEFACPLHQLFDKIGLEPFEGAHASVQQCHFGSAANSDVGKFKGNVSPADENHSPRQRIEL